MKQFYHGSSGFRKQAAEITRRNLALTATDYPSNVPDLIIPVAMAGLFQEPITSDPRVTKHWDMGKLMAAFPRFVQKKMKNFHFCFFVDGLDKYEGDHHELVHLFEALFDHTKRACVEYSFPQ